MALSDTLSEFVHDLDRLAPRYGELAPHLLQLRAKAEALRRYLDAPPYPEVECPACGQQGIPVRWPGCLEVVHPWGSCVSRR
jgi:hypothetical protein